jgi:HPt (histidine-containing phosphotransfer) domain-containing protein
MPDNSSPPPAENDPDSTPFEVGGLLRPLLEAGLQEDAREVVTLFIRAHEAGFPVIQAALARADLSACLFEAHALLGSSGGIGATALADGLRRLEQACKRADLVGARSAWSDLQTEQTRVLDALRRFLSESVSDG